MTEAELRALAEDAVRRGLVKLWGAAEIRQRLGGTLTASRVYQIVSGRSFPSPVAELANGNVWLAADVEAWIRARRPELAEPAEG